jgi:hypothetical protein
MSSCVMKRKHGNILFIASMASLFGIRRRSFPHADTRILPTDPEAWPRLRGAIALVAQKHFTALQIT